MSSTTTKTNSLAKSPRGVGSDMLIVPCAAEKTGDSAKTRRRARTVGIAYQRSKGVDAYVRAVDCATPMEIVAIERQGVPVPFIADLAKRMGLSISRLFNILGVAKVTAENKVADSEFIDGCAGQSAVRMIRLLRIAQNIVSNSAAVEAKEFDSTSWLGQWIEKPQPALAGCKPADLIDTPTVGAIVARLLGSIESGAYL